jgi:hypothetical protein
MPGMGLHSLFWRAKTSTQHSVALAAHPALMARQQITYRLRLGLATRAGYVSKSGPFSFHQAVALVARAAFRTLLPSGGGAKFDGWDIILADEEQEWWRDT